MNVLKMKKNRLLLFCLCMWSLCNPLWATDTLAIPQNDIAITIDGDLSDWNTINYTPYFVLHDKNTASTQKTRAKVIRDDQNLYFAFEVEDQNIVGTNQAHDAKLFSTDDLVEIFIDPDGDGQNYIEFGVNAYGNVYDYVIVCPSLSCGGWKDNQGFKIANLEVGTSVVGTINNSSDTDTKFLVEIKLPFASLTSITNGNFTVPAENDVWKVNLFRIDYGTTTEYQSWVPHNTFGFHQPSKFGNFKFDKKHVTALTSKTENRFWIYQKDHIKVLEDDVELSIINLQGQIINVVKQDNLYDLSALPTGVYIVRSLKEKIYNVEKIIID